MNKRRVVLREVGLYDGISEDSWQRDVIEAAERLGWICFCNHDSRRSSAGIPDLLLIRDKRLIWAELKTMKGNLSPSGWKTGRRGPYYHRGQEETIDLMRAAGQTVYVWRPNEMAAVIAVLED